MNCDIDQSAKKKLLSEECIECDDHQSIDEHLHCIHECNEWTWALVTEEENEDHLRRIHSRSGNG